MIFRVLKVCLFILLMLMIAVAIVAIIKLRGMWFAVNGQYYLVKPMARKGLQQGLSAVKHLVALMF